MKDFLARILCIMPYNGMQHTMERVAEDYPNIQMDIYTGDLENGLSIVRKHAEEDYDCIISRGGTAQLIQMNTDIPVVEIPLSVYDILHSMRLAENYTEEYAVVGFSSITKVAHILCDLLNKKINIYTVQNTEEAQDLLAKLQQNNCRAVIGDMVTYAIAQEHGMTAFLIISGTESLHQAVDQAAMISVGVRRLRQENILYRHMLRGKNENFIVLQRDGTVFLANPTELRTEFLDVFCDKLNEIPEHGVLKSYHNFNGRLFCIWAQWLHLGSKQYALFQYCVTRIPFHKKKYGLYFYDKNECEYLFGSSIYAIQGVLGELDSMVQLAAATQQPVLILGELGTEQDQMARFLYLSGKFCTNAFVMIDCALSADKIWSFLLNHVNSPLNDMGSTIYFHGFDKLTMEQGRELLSLLQASDLNKRQRLIFSCTCAEGVEPPALIVQLMQQVSVFLLTIPPLRCRADEIVSLACLYLGKMNLELGKQIAGFDSDALQQLRRFQWPGNYAQFQRILQELATLSDSYYINSNDVAVILNRERTMVENTSAPYVFPAGQTLEEIIHLAIKRTLAEHGGNQTATAQQLGISRTTLWRYMKKG